MSPEGGPKDRLTGPFGEAARGRGRAGLALVLMLDQLRARPWWMDEPLDQARARQLAATILEEGFYTFSHHAEVRMKQRSMEHLDCVNVIRGGRVTSIDFEEGTWRYRFETPRMGVAIAFASEDELVVVSCWRRE